MPRDVLGGVLTLLVGISLLAGCQKQPTVIEPTLSQDQVRSMLGSPHFRTRNTHGQTVWLYDGIGVDDYPMIRESDTPSGPQRRLLLKLAAKPFPPSHPDHEPGQYSVRLKLVFGPEDRLQSFSHQVSPDYGPGLDRPAF